MWQTSSGVAGVWPLYKLNVIVMRIKGELKDLLCLSFCLFIFYFNFW